jgi:aspartyl/glutamyl-tRNA(Asn/Gln) amidotransferase C subunit
MFRRFFGKKVNDLKDYHSDIVNATRAVKIELNNEEIEQLKEDLAAFKQWLKPLLDVNTAATEPLLYSHQLVNILREDEPVRGDLQKLQQAAAKFEKGFYRVPSIIE